MTTSDQNTTGDRQLPGESEGAARLQRVEEALGFAEHEQEQLGSQVVRLQQQVLALSQRIQQLEGLLERVVKRAAEGQDHQGEP